GRRAGFGFDARPRLIHSRTNPHEMPAMRFLRPLPFARRAVALGVAAALAACSTLPAYSPPAVAVPAHYAGIP
ncbi:hypothetical protein, partial [Escherichia coli]|uniref:hypothetical protein n=1 Tax=Escherichia coli TaxID=562 RepID=UPI0019D638A1